MREGPKKKFYCGDKYIRYKREFMEIAESSRNCQCKYKDVYHEIAYCRGA